MPGLHFGVPGLNPDRYPVRSFRAPDHVGVVYVAQVPDSDRRSLAEHRSQNLGQRAIGVARAVSLAQIDVVGRFQQGGQLAAE